ncbi:sensor histidine kinase KdpD [Petrotoga sp. 9PWA.NaAc.5.4]|uniref:sensor histidine kinase n=1 Tax=Petrotoga sp. 9PWA.NaAc.5.4 TaxID=1434328 RepID=UPI000CBACD08|nr:HAMP domain-containing sensor histidine kinase [Petrotoga sp. 9PWA.NaAc.5.4]PNR92843.1 histidine kinase [Petrotoga sp. 9PWA.NaAc.5.4]
MADINLKNNYFEIFEILDDAVINIEKGTMISKSNKKAKEWGFHEKKDLISIISFDKIDELTNHILNDQDYEVLSNIYFIKGETKYCRLNYYKSHKILIIQDKTEFELLKKIKADFITSVSHELRTPLAIAKGNTQILKDFMHESKFTQQIDKIQESLDRVEKIISQLTLLSLAEFGDYHLKNENINTLNLYNEVLNDLSDKIKEKSINIVFNCTVEKVYGDKFVLYTILRNLLSNAIKYSFENSNIYVDITAEKIQVKDEGIGIRDEEQNRIFERFYRGIEASKVAKGSGLGLSVVKYLCQLSGYKISFESKWMVGSTFIVTFA